MGDAEIDPVIDPERYIRLVAARGDQGEDPLRLIGIAAETSRELLHAGDVVLEHFVHEAHRTGCSWTLIGERLGISRQAARQRFGRGSAPDRGELHVLPRLRTCLDQARGDAERDGRDEIDTQYLLLGLLHVGVAAAALDRLGITRGRLREAMLALFGPPSAAGSPSTPPVFSGEARRAIDGAHTIARSRGHGYVGTEHVLYCLATDPGSQAGRVLHHLDVDAAAVKRELHGLVPRRPCPTPRRRRTGRARAESPPRAR